MRMIRLVSLIFGLLTVTAAQAQTVRVSSGDHADFTRIVVEFGSPVNWAVGRTADGYELQLDTGARPYDLTRVFDLIGKDRLAAIWADPADGALNFTIACACFAMPFEFRPGTVVIDIRNGQPPKGSSFEQPIDGSTVAALAVRPTVRPMKRPFATAPAPDAPTPVYDWTADLLRPRTEPGKPAGTAGLPLPQSMPIDLLPLRQSLIEQLSRGASQGIVQMADPGKPDATGAGGNPSVEIRMADEPNLLIRQKGESGAPLTAKGAECISDQALDIASWGGETAVVDQIGPMMSGLTGEFDIPDPDAVKRAVRFYLNIGFGAEARSLLRAFPTEQKDAAIWQSMARILDDEPDAQPAFAGMAACDTPAALWAVLADPEILASDQVEKSAILRAFAALPANLRRQLGPDLVDRFLSMQDMATAITLRDAVLRGTTQPGPETALMQAAIEKAGGSPSASESLLSEVATDSGPLSAQALAKLVVQRAEMGQDVTVEQVEMLEGYAREQEGGPQEAEFDHALTLAYAASGNFTRARDRIERDAEAAPTFWKILATSGPDSALLDIATLAAGQTAPRAATASAALVATRMLALGLADQAARWLQLVEAPPTLLDARIRVALGQNQDALALLQNDTSPAAFQIKVAALKGLGDERALSDLFAAAGMTEDQWRAISRLQDWDAIAAAGPEVWQKAAQSLTNPASATTPQDPSETGPLAQGRALLQSSTGTRAAIDALLDSVKSPTILTQ